MPTGGTDVDGHIFDALDNLNSLEILMLMVILMLMDRLI